jgi:hypothetical protein
VVATTDETPAALAAALRGAVISASHADLYVVPALGTLDAATYAEVAAAAGTTARSNGAVAILDPPAAVIDQVVATTDVSPFVTLAHTLTTSSPLVPLTSAVMLSSSVAGPDGAAPRAAAPAVAGLLAANDQADGVWVLADDAVPRWNPTTEQIGILHDMGITSLTTLPGCGTVVEGNTTVGAPSWYGALTTVRTGNYLSDTITNGLQQYVFQANDGQTWEQVTAAVSGFLTNVWQDGGLVGPQASDAFTVAVGIGSSLTSQDILNGDMVDVTARLAAGLPWIRSSTLEMQGV